MLLELFIVVETRYSRRNGAKEGDRPLAARYPSLGTGVQLGGCLLLIYFKGEFRYTERRINWNIFLQD